MAIRAASTFKIPNPLIALEEGAIADETPQYVIRAKTGWAMRIKPQIGWYVGYVETSGQIWFFATNIDIEIKSDSVYRKEITMEALEIKSII